MPLHKQKNVAHFPPQVTVNNTAQWLRNIERAVHEVAVQDNRAVLVVAQSIKAMRTISAYLISMGHAVRAYGDTDTLDDPTVVRRWLMTREVIVGTNLAGRGTDLKFTDRVKWNGGLHVIVSFHTTGDRTEKQNFGRVARAGDPGTTQLIINLPSYEFGKETNNDLLIEGLAITRDVEEKERMLVNALCQVPMVKLQDELFEEQVDLIHAVDSPTKLQFIVRKTECVKVNSPDACVFPAGKGGIKVKLNDRSGKTSVVDLTVKLSVVEPIAFKHILSVLHAPEGSGSKLSKTDFEVLNFLLAKVGFGAESEEVSKRVANAYTLAVTTSTTQPTVAGLAIYKRYHEDWLSWFNTGKEIIMQYLLTTVSIADEKVSEMSKEEIGLLEKTFLDADENYDGSDLTEKRLSDGKLKLMYKYWREDRALYTYEFELLQLQDDWALWLKKQTSLYMQNSTCRDVVIDGFSPGKISPFI